MKIPGWLRWPEEPDDLAFGELERDVLDRHNLLEAACTEGTQRGQEAMFALVDAEDFGRLSDGDWRDQCYSTFQRDARDSHARPGSREPFLLL